MMRPMKLGGEQLLFGRGCLEHLKQIPCRRAAVVTTPEVFGPSGILERVNGYLRDGGAEVTLIGVPAGEPDMETVRQGTERMKALKPDLIVALGGGSVMDAAKAMWIYYEHDDLHDLKDIMPPNPFPKLRGKARMCCVPSTSGTGSEVSRSIVITDDASGLKCGIGNMEMMPDIAVCDPEVTLSVPARLTAETGMDALTHAIEALTSARANMLCDVLAMEAVLKIFQWLPAAYEDGSDLPAREEMMDASLMAGLAFTNVSLGIAHSIAHTLGSFFKIPHGLANAIVLPYVIRYNRRDPKADAVYRRIERAAGISNLEFAVRQLNRRLNIPSDISGLADRNRCLKLLEEMVETALADGCTKTNPVIPNREEMKALFLQVYEGTDMSLICYLSNGYPTLEASRSTAAFYAAAGCDMIEIDFPSSDPYMDSEYIAGRMKAALSVCSDYGKYMESLKMLKEQLPGTHFLILIYEATVREIGLKRFTEFCLNNGFSDLILVGAKDETVKNALMEKGLKISCYIRYHLPADEVSDALHSNGFIYLQAKPESPELKNGRSLKDCIDCLREKGIGRPIYCGVGIAAPEDVGMVRDAGADAVFVGSAVLKLQDSPKELEQMIRDMKARCRHNLGGQSV